ncbi:MAG: imidazole glycerol phosphate synthase cyclase subunit [Oscillospiraceae bacterium]|nr:imidazole glycerol phosphate synthase cyclase subunit [Oscillospiraceae bacterium]
MGKQIKKLIACFDIINGRVTKAKNFFDNIDVAPAEELAVKICEKQIDGLIFFDVTASNEKRKIDIETLKKVAAKIKNYSVPFIVGGGIKTLDDMREVFEAGAADKISVDSMAVRNPQIIADSVKEFGSDRIVLSTQVKFVGVSEKIKSGYEVAIDGARVFTGIDALEWVKRVEDLGAGEICVNSIDKDGTCSGFDIDITGRAAELVSVPVIASGGAGTPEHLLDVFSKTKADSAIISSMLYSPRLERNYEVSELKKYLEEKGVNIIPMR